MRLASLTDAAHAIRSMQVRGAPLIGVTAAYGLALALAHKDDETTLAGAVATLAATRSDRRQSALGAGPHAVPLAPARRSAC